MSSEDSGKENHLPVEDLDQVADVTTDAAERREVTNSSDADGFLPSNERKTSLGEEPAAENGRDLPSDRGEIASLGKVQDRGDEAKEQSPDDKTDLESRNGITESSEKISLLSVHNCKLGEFPAIYLPGLPVVATVESNVLSNRSRGPQFKIILEHGVFSWTVHKHYTEILSLRRDLAPLRSRIRLGRRGRGRHRGYLPHLFTITDINPLQAARTRSQLPKVQRFMNAVLSDRQMRTQSCTVRFLELSRLSFVEDLGSKRKEGLVVKRSGGHRRVTNCLGCGACCVCRCSVWRERWLVMKNGCVAYIRCRDNSIADTLLFDEAMTVQTGIQQTGIRHGIKINTRSRELFFKCPSHGAMKAWKEELDVAMATEGKVWVEKKRFNSFAPPRQNSTAKWFVDGESYMSCVAKALLAAKEEIFITDWTLCPHLNLLRDDPNSIEWRLDRILHKKATEGVKVFIQLYKEITLAVDLGSEFVLESLNHPNIVIFRHPNHIQTNVFLWTHHEKIVVIDQTLAFVGGIDLAFGRYDNHCHPLTDIGRPPPTVKSVSELAKAVTLSLGIENREGVDSPDNSDVVYQKWVGKDYYNPFIKDFIELNKPHQDQIDRCVQPRMPWHDVAAVVYGTPARDVARHFIQRYNFTRHEQYENRGIPCLLPRRQFTEGEKEETSYLHDVIKSSSTANATVQVLRSVTEWSAGTPTEHSILNACLHTIKNAEHFIYIENQFFISSLPDAGVKNKFAEALRERISRAHARHKKFRVIIMMPLFPNFEGEIGEASGTQIAAVTHWNYKTICRGPDSLIGRLIAEHDVPEDAIHNYISVFGLRTYGELNGKPVSEIAYVHSKCMIADDRAAIIGSCNINDRSLLGERDSEMAIIVQDQDLVDSQMNGEPYKVGRFCHTLRCHLFREHLGLLEEQVMSRSDFDRSETSSSYNVEDPICDEFYHDTWIYNAKRNMQIYEEVLGGKNIPTDSVHSYEELKKFRRNSGLEESDPVEAMKRLRSTQGALVPMPLDFLREEPDLLPEFGTIEYVAPNMLFK